MLENIFIVWQQEAKTCIHDSTLLSPRTKLAPQQTSATSCPINCLTTRLCSGKTFFFFFQWTAKQTAAQKQLKWKQSTNTLPVKPRGHLQVYCGGDEGWLIVMHVAPFKQLFGFIRQASSTYWQNSPIHPGEQAHWKKEAWYSRYAGAAWQDIWEDVETI